MTHKTWDQVVDAFQSHTFKIDDVLIRSINGKQIFTKEWLTFVDDVKYYIGVALDEINLPVIKSWFDANNIVFLIKISNLYYAIELSRWSTYYYIYAIPDSKLKNIENTYLGIFKCTIKEITSISDPRDLFKVMSLPKHPRYKIGDYIVPTRAVLKSWSKDVMNKLYIITSIDFRGRTTLYQCINYNEHLKGKANVVYNFGESTIKRLDGGV